MTGIVRSQILFFATHVLIHQVCVVVTRVATSYRVIELGLPDIWIGAIAATFNLLPLILATRLGRLVDSKGTRATLLVGSGCVLAAIAGLWLFGQSVVFLLLCHMVLGFGHLICMVSQQSAPGGFDDAATRDRLFAQYMAIVSIGQILGPMLISSLAGDALVPDASVLLLATLGLAGLSMMMTMMLRNYRTSSEAGPMAPSSTLSILRRPHALAAIATGALIICSMDLLVVYLPLLGAEAGLPAATVAAILSVRAAVSLLSRLVFGRLCQLVGRRGLLILSLFATSAGFAGMGVSASLVSLLAGAMLVGLGIGLGTPITMSWLMELVPASSRGLTLSLRISGNRFAQFLIPALAGLASASAGLGIIFVLIAVGLLAATATTIRSSRGMK